jgi:hypothetical protein
LKEKEQQRLRDQVRQRIQAEKAQKQPQPLQQQLVTPSLTAQRSTASTDSSAAASRKRNHSEIVLLDDFSSSATSRDAKPLSFSVSTTLQRDKKESSVAETSARTVTPKAATGKKNGHTTTNNIEVIRLDDSQPDVLDDLDFAMEISASQGSATSHQKQQSSHQQRRTVISLDDSQPDILDNDHADLNDINAMVANTQRQQKQLKKDQPLCGLSPSPTKSIPLVSTATMASSKKEVIALDDSQPDILDNYDAVEDPYCLFSPRKKAKTEKGDHDIKMSQESSLSTAVVAKKEVASVDLT